MPAPLNRNGRTVRPGKRLWNGHEVDGNLQDEWLERLNDLVNFGLISICEGHAGERRGYRSCPHMILRLSEAATPVLVSAWSEIRFKLYNHLSFHQFAKQFRVDFELSSSIRLNQGVLHSHSPRDKFLVRIDSVNQRRSLEIETWCNEFFEQAIGFAEFVDCFFGDLLV